MFSAYLNTELKLTEDTATMEGGRKQIIVLHRELKEIIQQKLRGKVHYEYPCVIPSLTDAVVTCRMWDDHGNDVTEMGEATESTRNSNIADSFPTTTAANRAFDRAAISFLALGNVYSNLEIAPDGPKRYDSDKLTDAQTTTEVQATQSTTPIAQSHTSAIQQPHVVVEKEPCQTPLASPTIEVQDQKSEDPDASTIISIGKYAGKNKTIAEIYSEEPNWVQYISSLNYKKDELKEQIESVKRFLARQVGK